MSLVANSPPQPPAPVTPAVEARRRISLELACHVAKICAEFRGKDTVVLDMTAVTPIFDFFVITTCTNPRTLAAIANEARVQMKARGQLAPATEGEDSKNWILQDWGDVVAHLMLEETRELYDLEGLWADATRVDWQSVVGNPILATAR
jgi:ribosome-associated protein